MLKKGHGKFDRQLTPLEKKYAMSESPRGYDMQGMTKSTRKDRTFNLKGGKDMSKKFLECEA